MKWPISAEELIKQLGNSGPLKCIYNALAWSAHPSRTLNEYGYVKTPNKIEAEKNWAISSDWECLVSKQRSVKSTALSLTINRLRFKRSSESFIQVWPRHFLHRHKTY